MGQVLLPSGAVPGALASAASFAATVAAIPGLWRGHDLAHSRCPGFATGFAALDAELPGRGWPAGALTEVLQQHAGIGEMRLFFPALGALARTGASVFLLAPPWIPYAPAFAGAGIPLARLIVVRPRRPADALWACEQILKGLSAGALLAWPRHLRAQDARRLQLAVEGKPVLAVLMRPGAAASEATPAALRIALEATHPETLSMTAMHGARFGVGPDTDQAAPSGSLALRILKRRGGMLARPIMLSPLPPLFAPSPRTSFNDSPPHVVDRDLPDTPASRLHPAGA